MSTIITHFNRWYISSFEEERHVFIYVTGVPMCCNYSDVKPWMYCRLIHMRKCECRKAFHYMSWAVESVATVRAICDVTNSLHVFWKLVGIHVLQNCECQFWRVNKFVFLLYFCFSVDNREYVNQRFPFQLYKLPLVRQWNFFWTNMTFLLF